MTVYVVTALVHSTYGRGFIAVRDDEVAAEAMGINTDANTRSPRLSSARFLPAWRADFTRTRCNFITPSGFNFMHSIDIVVMVILGGMGNTAGVIARRDPADPAAGMPAAGSTEYRMIIYSLLLIVLMLTRPQGLFTWKRKSTRAGMTSAAANIHCCNSNMCTIRFGGLTAVSDLDLQIGRNELVGLIGPNGAGKTTVFNLITGVYQPTAGGISFDGQSIAGRKPYRITARGIARTFQNIRLFPSLTVFDNVRAAFHLHLQRRRPPRPLARARVFGRGKGDRRRR